MMPSRPRCYWSGSLAIADGPTEVHKVTLASQLLKEYQPAPGTMADSPSAEQEEVALARYSDILELEVSEFSRRANAAGPLSCRQSMRSVAPHPFTNNARDGRAERQNGKD